MWKGHESSIELDAKEWHHLIYIFRELPCLSVKKNWKEAGKPQSRQKSLVEQVGSSGGDKTLIKNIYILFIYLFIHLFNHSFI